MELGRRTVLVAPGLDVGRSIARARLKNPRTVGLSGRWGRSRELKNKAEFSDAFRRMSCLLAR